MVESSVNEFTLLCEGCGYEIEGLDHESACPECGRAVALSLPERRAGSPWQRENSRRAYIRTCVLVLGRPRSCWDELLIGRDDDLELLAWNVLLGSGAMVFGVGTMLGVFVLTEMSGVTDPGLGELAGLVLVIMTGVLLAMVGSVPLAFALFALTAIESAGIRTFGRVRNRRITRAVATTIVSHASIGWLVGGVLAGLGVWVGTGLSVWARETNWAKYQLMFLMPVVLPIAGMLVGMLLFETLTWLGVMRLKYANRQEPEPVLSRQGTTKEPGA